MGNKLKKYSAEITVSILYLLTYLPTLIWMGNRWFARDSYYSHGVLVPLVSAFLVWQGREELAKIERKPSVWGWRLIIVGLLIHIASSLVRVYFTSGFSMLIVLSGLVLHFYGQKILRKVLFPLGFLFFMMPMPLLVIVNISFQMKLFAAEIAERILNSMGLLAVRTGSIIRMRHAFVIVDDVCSGLRSLISLAALGSIFAHWLKGPYYKKFVLLLMTAPIAVVTNVCRVIFLSSISEIWGPKYATGFVHDFSGFAVFALAFVMLMGVLKLIE